MQIGREPLDRPVADYMRRNTVALDAGQTVEEALAHLRTRNLDERIAYLYVLGLDGRLEGVVATRRLLMSPLDARVAEICQKSVVCVPADASLLLACELFVMHRFLALPVVDSDGRLQGVLDVSQFADEVIDLGERHAADDAFQLIGVRMNQAQMRSAWARFSRRFPWLLCNIVGGLLCAVLASRYETLLDSVVVLAVFIPIVLALSESVSVQSMALTLQAIHRQPQSWRFMLASLGRELPTAALLGGASGGLVGAAAWMWRGETIVAATIGGTIFLAVITACGLGAILPMAVHIIRGDPKIASGPITLALADLATLLVYFSIAGRLLA